jgi:hypothetical protein
MGHLRVVIVHICFHCALYRPLHFIPYSHLHVRDSIALSYLVPTFGTHRVLSSKTTLIMPSRRVSQRLHPDEVLPQALTQNHPPLYHPSTQILTTITKGSEHPAFGDILEVQLYQPANISTTAAGSSQNGGGASSTQTNGGDPHQSPLRAPLSIQVI